MAQGYQGFHVLIPVLIYVVPVDQGLLVLIPVVQVDHGLHVLLPAMISVLPPVAQADQVSLYMGLVEYVMVYFN